MSKKNGAKRKRTAEEILSSGGLSQRQILQSRLAHTAQTMGRDMWLIQMLLVSGGEVLRDEFGMSTDDLDKWGSMTLASARENLAKSKGKQK